LKILRFIGVANLLFVGAGVVALRFQVWVFNFLTEEVVGNRSSPIWHANRVGQIAAALLLVSLVYAGVRLLQGKASALGLTSAILASELTYALVVLLFWWVMLRDFELSLKSLIFFNLGIAPQILTGYPIVALIMLSRLSRHDANRESGLQP
jgi:hypothetical protein